LAPNLVLGRSRWRYHLWQFLANGLGGIIWTVH